MQRVLFTINVLLMLAFVAAVSSQELEMEWQSPAGSQPITGFAPLKPAEYLMDANGDGKQEIAMFDKVMKPVKLVVISGKDQLEKWEYTLPEEVNAKTKLIGFYEIARDGGFKEAVIVQREGNKLIGVLEGGKVKVESGVVQFSQNYVLLGIDDYDADGDLEMYIGETEKNVVEIWGIGD